MKKFSVWGLIMAGSFMVTGIVMLLFSGVFIQGRLLEIAEATRNNTFIDVGLEYVVGDGHLQTSSYDISKVQNIVIEAVEGDIRVVTGESDEIHVICTEDGRYGYDVSLKNGQLSVIRRWHVFNFSLPLFLLPGYGGGHDVVIELPKEYEAEGVKLSTVSGSIDADVLTAGNTVEISSTSGEIRSKGIHAGYSKVENISGSIIISRLSASNAAVTAVSGDIDLENCDTGTLKISSVSGSVDVENLSQPDEYSIRMDTVSGSRRLDGLGISDSGPAGSGLPRTLEISTISGSISVNR